LGDDVLTLLCTPFMLLLMLGRPSLATLGWTTLLKANAFGA